MKPPPDKFIKKLKDYLVVNFKHDPNYPIEATLKVIDRFFREIYVMDRIHEMQEIEDKYAKYKTFKELFEEPSQYQKTMDYLKSKQSIDSNGKWLSGKESLITTLKTIHKKHFKKNIPKSILFFRRISYKFFHTDVKKDTVKQSGAYSEKTKEYRLL